MLPALPIVRWKIIECGIAGGSELSVAGNRHSSRTGFIGAAIFRLEGKVQSPNGQESSDSCLRRAHRDGQSSSRIKTLSLSNQLGYTLTHDRFAILADERTPAACRRPQAAPPMPSPPLMTRRRSRHRRLCSTSSRSRAPRQGDGWTPGMQRMFIAWLASTDRRPRPATSSARRGAASTRSTVRQRRQLSRLVGRGSRPCRKRRIAALATRPGGAGALRAPVISRAPLQRTVSTSTAGRAQPGEVLNEQGEWEDEASIPAARRGGEREYRHAAAAAPARLYLAGDLPVPGQARRRSRSSPSCPIDWGKAERLSRSPTSPTEAPTARARHDPGRRERLVFGEIGYGPDKKAELRAAIDAHRAERRVEPVDVGGVSTERSEQARSATRAVRRDAEPVRPTPER